ncbi:hypothetical protein CEXT_341171 [Caerostris extrusa]|uniref:Uncharacterized protein n=1 Tax=Caerostris extrusa TaxID=172846 RepID=A0AAV4QW58_CAEEX|nr:hypothetical protein CEXT_341171 [Caerostris extrusa]
MKKRIEGEYRSMKASHNRNVETQHEGIISQEKETEKNVSHSFNSSDTVVESDSDKGKELEGSLYSVIVPDKNTELPHIQVTREIEEEEIVDYVFTPTT